jgi:CarD family transcriptional regulator
MSSDHRGQASSTANHHLPEGPEGARSPRQAAAKSLTVGERVFFPRHGIGVIRERGQRQLLGHRRDYLTIEVARAGMQIMLPADEAASAGLRSPSDGTQAEAALAVLSAAPEPMSDNWRTRTKDNEARLATGQITELAAIMRDLGDRQVIKGLSSGERDLYQRARDLLTGDLMVGLQVDEAAVAARIDRVVDAA